MRKSTLVQFLAVGFWAALLLVVQGCGATSSSVDLPHVSARAETTPDGLIRVETDADGDLFLRPDHGIGGYDSIVVAPAFLKYRRRSVKLNPADEEVYLVSMEQALVDEAHSIGAPIDYEIGECVVKVGIGFVNVNLARSNSADMLGEMLLVIEFQDSLSGESLLRLLVPKRIARESEGVSREEQVSASFERMIDEVNISTALRGATQVPSKPRAGCQGKLLNAGLPIGES